jgi:hypothetical protein
MNRKNRVFAVLVALVLMACGENDRGGSGTGFGQFKDSKTSGLSYVSGIYQG